MRGGGGGRGDNIPHTFLFLLIIYPGLLEDFQALLNQYICFWAYLHLNDFLPPVLNAYAAIGWIMWAKGPFLLHVYQYPLGFRWVG